MACNDQFERMMASASSQVFHLLLEVTLIIF